jgi:hypothetical protein
MKFPVQVLLAAVLMCAGCANDEVTASAALELAERAERVEPERLRPDGTLFANADGSRFHWRGVTAFRLAEMVANGREAEAAAYLDWASANGVTVVRVLAIARHLFQLAPADGLRALPRLLELAAARGIHVEVVALADTLEFQPADIEAQVMAVGKIAAAHPNALVELANEPFHHTQHPSLHDRATLTRLAALVPDEVVVAYGSDAPETSGGGEYVTVHMPRSGGWGHVSALAQGAELVARYARPVVSDEPIGVAAEAIGGRRDNSPERLRAAALLTRMTGMHATFHYEGGLQARVPEGVELACFQAWREAWTLLPEGIEKGTFSSPSEGVFETALDGEIWTLRLDGTRAALSSRAR